MTNTTPVATSTRGLAFPLIVIALVVYFGYFAIYGTHGLLNWVRLQHEIETQRTEFAAIQTERAALEHRVKLLRPESVDPDLLEEQARARLGLSEPDEVVILKDKK